MPVGNGRKPPTSALGAARRPRGREMGGGGSKKKEDEAPKPVERWYPGKNVRRGTALNHTQVAGLDYKLKAPRESRKKLTRAINHAQAEGSPLSAAQASDMMEDVLRYTVLLPNEAYTKAVKDSLDALKKHALFIEYQVPLKNSYGSLEISDHDLESDHFGVESQKAVQCPSGFSIRNLDPSIRFCRCGMSR